MRRWRPWSDRSDEGSAALEFVFGGLVLLVPIVYLVVALGAIQAHTLGAEAGARHIARAVAAAHDGDDASQRAQRVLAVVVGEYGLAADEVDVAIACRPAVTPCPRAGATVVVTVSSRVALPLVPSVLGLDRLASIPVEASTVQKVSRFWGAG